MGQLESTALKSNQHSGWATITHPFHPLRGQRFKILSNKTFNNRDILSLQALTQGTGTVAIPREWTDKADPTPYQDTINNAVPILSYLHLQQLADLVVALAHPLNNEENN